MLSDQWTLSSTEAARVNVVAVTISSVCTSGVVHVIYRFYSGRNLFPHIVLELISAGNQMLLSVLPLISSFGPSLLLTI